MLDSSDDLLLLLLFNFFISAFYFVLFQSCPFSLKYIGMFMFMFMFMFMLFAKFTLIHCLSLDDQIRYYGGGRLARRWWCSKLYRGDT